MSDFNGILDLINETNETNDTVVTQKTVNEQQIIQEKDLEETVDELNVVPGTPFDIKEFAKELYKKSESKNKAYMEIASSISGHDVAHNCILSIVNKLTNTPIKNFSDKWLPIFMRNTIGSAIHDFIQTNSNQFTETEVSIKVPSIRFSGRIDCLISNNILVEVKSCTYKDYEKIIRTQKPRVADFLQSMTYKYILENHLNEIKTSTVPVRSPKPRLPNYDIKQIQFIYIAHDIVSSDVENFGEALAAVERVKKTLKSPSDNFYFIKSFIHNLDDFDNTPYMEFIKNKIDRINYYIDNNKWPDKDDQFINKKACFFCLYYPTCSIK